MEEDQYYTSICSAATLQSDKKGFFQSYADTVTEQAGRQWLEQFCQLTTDSDRLLKCYNDTKLYETVHGVLQNVMPLYRSKAANISQLRRMEGDRSAQNGRLEQALLLLTQSVIRAPVSGVDCNVDNGLSLALALWSRARTLWQLSEHSLCLTDLQLCVKEKITDDLRTEVYWLMAQCYEQLCETTRAKVTLQVMLKLLPPEDTNWKEKVEAKLAKLSDNKKQELCAKKDKDDLSLLDGEHQQLPGLSVALSVRSGENSGRYVVARQPLNTGDVLAVEPPYAACLLPTKFGSHCHHCFSRLRSAVPCAECSGLAFCSVKCRESAQTYHVHECRYMDLMIGSGMSILCYVALRTVTQQKYKYWLKLYNKQPVSPDYNRMASLVTHADKRQPKDFVNRTLMALFLLRILEHSKYIPPSDCDEGELSGMTLFLGCVLLHLLQCLQFNAHEIYETMYKAELDFAHSKINYVAVGVYPSVALFNHDCYPAVMRYFRGKDIVIRAVRPLSPGDVVAENYGPVFTMRTRAERQRSLTSRYWFSCECTACCEDWPQLSQLDENMLNIRCQTKSCAGFISTQKDAPKSRAKSKCTKCSASVSLEEAVMLVKSYDSDYSQALELMSEGRLSDAAQIFSTYSDVMHVVCRPPNKNVSLAHEALRSCLAYHHNKYIVK